MRNDAPGSVSDDRPIAGGDAVPPSPCFVIDEAALRRNAAILRGVRDAAGCRIVLALKGFALWHVFPVLREYLDGCCASGAWEARLAHEEFGGHVLTYSPGFTGEDIEEVLPFTHHLDFNSLSQWERFRGRVMEHPRFRSGELLCGLRINPEHSTGQTPLYDPCVPGSRLGITADQLEDADLDGIAGLHFHTLCEQNSDDLESTLDAVDRKFGDLLRRPQIRYLNMGGGHWITKPFYDRDRLVRLVRETSRRYDVEVWLEPGEAVAIHTGTLHASVIDVFRSAGHDIAILDVSATAHMPDVLEMPYRPEVFGPDGSPAGQPGEHAHTYRLGGPTCLAGDVVGDFSFPAPLHPGDRLVFDDMAHYTMVKTTTFNGVRHPAIAIRRTDGSLDVVRRFTYDDFRSRLG